MVASRRFERVFTWLVKFIVASGGLRLLRSLSLYGRPQITKLPGACCRADVRLADRAPQSGRRAHYVTSGELLAELHRAAMPHAAAPRHLQIHLETCPIQLMFITGVFANLQVTERERQRECLSTPRHTLLNDYTASNVKRQFKTEIPLHVWKQIDVNWTTNYIKLTPVGQLYHTK